MALIASSHCFWCFLEFWNGNWGRRIRLERASSSACFWIVLLELFSGAALQRSSGGEVWHESNVAIVNQRHNSDDSLAFLGVSVLMCQVFVRGGADPVGGGDAVHPGVGPSRRRVHDPGKISGRHRTGKWHSIPHQHSKRGDMALTSIVCRVFAFRWCSRWSPIGHRRKRRVESAPLSLQVDCISQSQTLELCPILHNINLGNQWCKWLLKVLKWNWVSLFWFETR